MNAPPAPRLFVKTTRSPEQVLLTRCALLAILVAAIMAIFWYDRDGLRDQVDGHISFSDVAYFTAVTITTVGYGDIVPVSDRARIMDALLVTPLRLIIWLVFMGTAYELVLQRWMEERRMRRIQDRLANHLIVCGYGHGGQSAAREAVARGTPAEHVLVVDRDAASLTQAAEQGHVGIQGDVTHEHVLCAAGIPQAKAVMVCLGRDDTTVLTVLTIRQINPSVRVICSVSEAENIKLIYQAGADAIIAPSMIGGYLMTNSVQSSHVADYVSDLMRAGGRVRLIERAARPEELGHAMRDAAPGMVVCLHRGSQRIGFWEGEQAIIQAGDTLLVIESNQPDAAQASKLNERTQP